MGTSCGLDISGAGQGQGVGEMDMSTAYRTTNHLQPVNLLLARSLVWMAWRKNKGGLEREKNLEICKILPKSPSSPYFADKLPQHSSSPSRPVATSLAESMAALYDMSDG